MNTDEKVKLEHSVGIYKPVVATISTMADDILTLPQNKLQKPNFDVIQRVEAKNEPELMCENIKIILGQVIADNMQINLLRSRIAGIEQEIAVLENGNKVRLSKIDRLRRQGYCALDSPRQRRDPMTGRVTKEWFDHQYYCKNKKRRIKGDGLAE